LKVTALDEPDRRSSLIRCALHALALTLDGRPAAPTTIARKRAVFHGVLNYAVELDILPANPISKVTWKAPEVAAEIDRRVVVSPRQVLQVLAAVSSIRSDLTAFFGCLYYATMPGEAVALRQADCVAVLLRVYAGYIDDQIWNNRIDEALLEGATGLKRVAPWFRRQPPQSCNHRE